jgi:ElaB/YqjD/DUF883 family membrane-anchored ribosome-binding protein
MTPSELKKLSEETATLREHLQKADEILEDTEYDIHQIEMLMDSVNGYAGQEFENLRKEWESQIKVLEKKIQDKTVEFKMRLNAIK